MIAMSLVFNKFKCFDITDYLQGDRCFNPNEKAIQMMNTYILKY